MKLTSGYEWLIAWRHLRSQDKRGWRLIGVGVAKLGLAALVWLASRYAPPGALGQAGRLGQMGALGAVGLACVGFLLVWLGVLLRSFSVFTSISIFGVFLGTCALVIVLAVMSGFEGDLRGKILGTRAHAAVRAQPVLSSVTITVPRAHGKPARTATVEMRTLTTTFATMAAVRMLRTIATRTQSIRGGWRTSFRIGEWRCC